MRVSVLGLVLLAGCKFVSGGTDAGIHDMTLTGGKPTAVIASTPAPAGLATVLDGSGSTDPQHRTLGYAWHIAAAPAGSSVGDKQLSATNTAMVNFASDRGGAYSVQLTVTAPDGDSDTATAMVTVPTLALFFRQSRLTPDSDSFVTGVVRSDGTGARALGCATTVADNAHGDAGAGNRAIYGDTPGTVGLRTLDGDGTPSKVVYEDVTATGRMLFASDENGDCNAQPPVRLDATPNTQHLFPRFSPDGTRVAWIDVGTTAQLYTAALDGSARHLVRGNAAKLKQDPPLWIDATHLAWIEDVSMTTTPHLNIVEAADGDGAGDTAATVLLDCDPAKDASALQIIDQFAYAGNTLVIAGGTSSRTAKPPGATQLYAMAAASCSSTAATTLASEPSTGFAWDFDLSPDGSAIVYAAQESPGSPLHDIYRVLLGSPPSLPSRFIGSTAGIDDIGPRFIAGGRQLTWTQAVTDASRGGLVVASYDGSNTRTILGATQDGGATVVYVGGVNRGLDCAVGGERSTLADVFIMIGALCLLRRRRRTS